MKNNPKARIVLTAIALTLAVVGSVVLVLSPQLPKETTPTLGAMSNHIELSFEEVAAKADYIMDAVYTGSSTTEYGTELMFRPVKLIKGSMVTSANANIYVQPIDDLSVQPEYKAGKTYMLFLNKHSSVYYDHDKYTQLGGLYIPENDAKWKNYHTQVTQIAAASRNSPTESTEKRYTDATDIDEVIAFSENIFVVRIDSVLAVSTVGPTTVYNCTVLKTVKNTPNGNGKIYITLFNDTVSVGGEYLVLLAETGETSLIYGLSSSDSSVYSMEVANAQPSLKALLEQAATYSALDTSKSDQEVWEDEQKAREQY